MVGFDRLTCDRSSDTPADEFCYEVFEWISRLPLDPFAVRLGHHCGHTDEVVVPVSDLQPEAITVYILNQVIGAGMSSDSAIYLGDHSGGTVEDKFDPGLKQSSRAGKHIAQFHRRLEPNDWDLHATRQS